ncbi:MAG: hypothetical protein AB4080_14985 [Trichodesmium sp.]
MKDGELVFEQLQARLKEFKSQESEFKSYTKSGFQKVLFQNPL